MAFIIGGTTGAIIGGSIIGGGLGLIGAGMQAGAAEDAAATQSAAANRATDLQRDMFNQQRADQEPWRQAGMGALTQLGNADFQRDFTAADFQKDPGYDFRMREGQKALERQAAAKGSFSGGTLKSLSRYGQDYASGEYQNAYNRFNADRDRRFNRLSSIAGLGQTATNQVGQAGQNFANAAGQNMIGAANAQAAGQMAGAQAWGNALGGMGNNWMQYSMLSQFAPRPGGGAGVGGTGTFGGMPFA